MMVNEAMTQTIDWLDEQLAKETIDHWSLGSTVHGSGRDGGIHYTAIVFELRCELMGRCIVQRIPRPLVGLAYCNPLLEEAKRMVERLNA